LIELTEKQIEDIADFLDCGLTCLYNKKTKELITITEFDDSTNPDEIEWDDIIEFERMNSNDSFELMADFVEQLNDSYLKEKLIAILNNSKPFKNFKTQIDNSGEYRQKWFDFKNKKYINYVKSQIEAIYEDEIPELDFDQQIDFEVWEIEASLYEQEDWIGLLDLHKRQAEKYPTDLHRQEDYAIALNLNKKYAETIKLLEPLYRKNYEIGFGVSEIMEALVGLNKTEDDFDWVKKPTILKLDEKTINLCAEFFKRKRKPRSVSEIYSHLLTKADYLNFDEGSLAKYILNFSNLFDIIEESSDFQNIQIKLKKKK